MAPEPHLRMLVLGDPKVGKTYTTLSTCEGPAYVICCDGESSLAAARKSSGDFFYDEVTDQTNKVFNQMESALLEATKGAREGRYKTIILDTLSAYAANVQTLTMQPESANPPDPRKAWPLYSARLRNVIARLICLPAHVVVLSHYIEAKQLNGAPALLPNISDKLARQILGMMSDNVFMEIEKDGSRVFRCSIKGVYGPGCRSVPGVETVPADLRAFSQRAAFYAQSQVQPQTNT